MPENKQKPTKKKSKTNKESKIESPKLDSLENPHTKNKNEEEPKNNKTDNKDQEELIKSLTNEISLLKQDLEKEKELVLRNLAETENFKKRKLQESENSRKFAVEGLVKDLLPVIDSLELACSQKSDDTKDNKILEGVELTQKQLYSVLDKVGVSLIETKNQIFDPNKHQSIGQEACPDIKSDTIIKEMQKGYMLHDRVIRPSLVVIAE